MIWTQHRIGNLSINIMYVQIPVAGDPVVNILFIDTTPNAAILSLNPELKPKQ